MVNDEIINITFEHFYTGNKYPMVNDEIINITFEHFYTGNILW
jgi:hypothetical protein